MVQPKSPHTGTSRADRQQPLPHVMYDTDTEYSTTSQQQLTDSLHPNVLNQIEKMLQKALKLTSDHITEKLTKEIKIEDMETNIMTHENELDSFKNENLLLQTRLEDFKNRARRSNIRIRGIPESIIDLPSTITALFQDLTPSISIERLEIDRIHRALAPRKSEGPPRDIIVKFHFFRTKEQIIVAARSKETLIFQGHPYQIFADLSPVTVAKRRTMKPLLQNLQQHQIPYQWGFPFSLRFLYQSIKHSCKSYDELLNTLQKLHLCERPSASPRRRTISSSPQNTSKIGNDRNKQSSSKRGRFNSPDPDPPDSMD